MQVRLTLFSFRSNDLPYNRELERPHHRYRAGCRRRTRNGDRSGWGARLVTLGIRYGNCKPDRSNMIADPPIVFVAFTAVFLIAFMKGAFGGGFTIIGIPMLALVMEIGRAS